MLTSTWIHMEHLKLFQWSSGPLVLHKLSPAKEYLGGKILIEINRERKKQGRHIVIKGGISAAQKKCCKASQIYSQRIDFHLIKYLSSVCVKANFLNLVVKHCELFLLFHVKLLYRNWYSMDASLDISLHLYRIILQLFSQWLYQQ